MTATVGFDSARPAGQERLSSDALLARRAMVLERLARWYRREASRTGGARAVALRNTAGELHDEVLRFAGLTSSGAA